MVNENKIFINKLYKETFKVSDRTASRDLKGLVIKIRLIQMGNSGNEI